MAALVFGDLAFGGGAVRLNRGRLAASSAASSASFSAGVIPEPPPSCWPLGSFFGSLAATSLGVADLAGTLTAAAAAVAAAADGLSRGSLPPVA